MGEGLVNPEDIAEAYAVLDVMRKSLDGLIDMTKQMAEAAKRCDAPGLSFSAEMMLESIEEFREEMTRFVVERAVP
jgi:hypothetical protein